MEIMGITSVAGMYVMPEFSAADSISAVAVGIVSRLAATGMDQMVKQIKQ